MKTTRQTEGKISAVNVLRKEIKKKDDHHLLGISPRRKNLYFKANFNLNFGESEQLKKSF